MGSVSYDEYGENATHTGTALSAIGYTGNWTDPGTGLVYLRARNYDPSTGQFTSVDPLVDRTRNPYSYAGNSPVDTTDPSGLCVHVLGQPIGSDCPLSERIDAATSNIPIYGQIHSLDVGIIAFIGCAGHENALTCAVTGFDPAYAAIDGTGRFVGDVQSGCSVIALLNDGGEAVSGAVGTVAIATGGEGMGSALVRSRLITVDDIMSNPNTLSGRSPQAVEKMIGDTPGWRVETLRQGDHAGQGWVLRQYGPRGTETGPHIRWHPGGGHHGPDPYWRVIGPNGDIGGVIQ